MTAPATLRLLGPVELEQGGHRLHLERYKAVAMLAYLAVTGRAHPRDVLATMLWPEQSQTRARADLRGLLTLLRQTLGAETFVADRQTIGLHARAPLRVDTASLLAARRTVAAHGHPDGTLCERCAPQLEAAVALVRGDFMAGFSLRDSPDFDDWQRLQSEQFQAAICEAYEGLARHAEAMGDLPRALGFWQRRLHLDPLHEATHRALMAVHARAGNRAQALAQFDACAQRLEEELGVPPAPETVALAAQIRQGQIGAVAARARPAPRHNLPPDPTPLVGRAEELAQIEARLRDPGCRLLTLVGLGGTGKTRLALAVAQRLRGRAAHGTFFVPLGALPCPQLVVPTIAETIGFTFFGRERPGAQLLDALREKQMLLILDNFEHVLEATAWLAELHAAAPGVQCLVTSRERLDLYEEWLFPVQGLRWVDDGAASAAAPSEAAQLFVQSAQRTAPTFSLTPETSPHVARLCEIVEGMPLALELAAGWVRMMSCETIVTQIATQLDFLTTSARNVPARHQSVRAVFECSWQRLLPDEQQGLRRLAVFHGPFDQAAAAAIAELSLPLLARLVDKSLLRHEAEGHFTLHDLLRQFLAEKLANDPAEEAATRARHVDWYGARLEAAAARLSGPDQATALAEIGHCLDNARAARAWALAVRGPAALERLVDGLFGFYEMRGRIQEGEVAFREMHASLEGSPGAATGTLRGRLLARHGLFLAQLGRYDGAQAQLAAARTIAAAQGDGTEAALALVGQGTIARALGDLERAADLLAAGLACAREAGDQEGEADALSGLGVIACVRGDYGAARQWHDAALALRRALGGPRAIAASLNNLGNVYALMGEPEAARRAFREGYGLFVTVGDQRGIGVTLNNIGNMDEALGNLDEARASYERSLQIREEVGDRQGMIYPLCNLGYIALAQGACREAAALYGRSLSISEALGHQYGIILCQTRLGDVALAAGERHASREHLLAAFRLALAQGNAPLALQAVVSIAALLDAQGDVGLAATALDVVMADPRCEQPVHRRAAALRGRIPVAPEQAQPLPTFTRFADRLLARLAAGEAG